MKLNRIFTLTLVQKRLLMTLSTIHPLPAYRQQTPLYSRGPWVNYLFKPSRVEDFGKWKGRGSLVGFPPWFSSGITSLIYGLTSSSDLTWYLRRRDGEGMWSSKLKLTFP